MPVAPPVATPGWLQRFSSLDRPARIRLGIGLALFALMVAAAAWFAGRPDYRVLFANLSDKDGGAVVAQLAQMNVPYKYTEGARRSHLRRAPAPGLAGSSQGVGRRV